MTVIDKCNFHTVAFDLDGTLSDPYRGLTAGFRYAFAKMNIDYGDESVLRGFIGPSIREEWMRLYGLTRDGAEQAVDYFREYYSVYGWWDNDLYDGIPELLHDIKMAGKRIVLATSKPDVHSRKILDKFDLYKYFDFACGASFDSSRERKSEVLRYALDNIGVTPDEYDGVVLVGDTKYDMEGAKEVGVHSIGVLYGYGSKDELLREGAEILVKDIPSLHNILLGK